MKISLSWLADFVEWKETDPRKIADALTLGTAEVEEIEEQGALLNHVCVGEVLTVARHPDADRLCIAEVKTDKGVKKVVCGGTNVKQGMLVAFAHVGATVKWHGGETMTLEPVKIRGVASEGMICAAEELDLGAMFPPQKEDGERPVIDLGRLLTTHYSLQPGDALRDVLQLNDVILHVNNTAITTRPDLFSHIGFARECVALGLAEWKKKPAFKTPPSPKAKSQIHMHLDEPTLVPRYLSCMLEIDALGETPDWMKKKLESVGIRSVSLPVDITNYVMIEIGVPMHSFDAGDIQGDVHMRLSTKGEKIVTLDEKERELPEGALVLSDDAGVFDLVGIMGGLRSSTKPTTRKIFLHALSIDSPTIRHAIIATGHRTDAATVYEKGVPPITTEQGFIRALELFLELVPGAHVVSAIENVGDNGKPKAIKVETDVIRSTLGSDVNDADIVKILEDLEFAVKKGTKKSQLTVTPPLHRLRDVSGVHDIVEEVGRIHGFGNITPAMPSAELRLPVRDNRIHRMRDDLKASGFYELVPLAFVSPALLQETGLPVSDAVAIKNPLGEETSLLQTHTLPHLLAHAQRMLPQTAHDLRTFQWGHVFSRENDEYNQMTCLIAAKNETGMLDDPFLRAKRDIMNAAAAAGYHLTVEKTDDVPGYAHPGRTAVLMFDKEAVGFVYEVHPAIRANFDLPHRAAAATLNLHLLLKHHVQIPVMQPIAAFPAVTYDVTVKRTRADVLGPVLQKMRGADKLLEDVTVQDIYDGKPLTNGDYNLTLRFTYRSPEKTLTDPEAAAAHTKVLAAGGIA